MERVRFTEDGHWNCPKCGAQASGKKCNNCKFLIYAGFLPRAVSGLADSGIIKGAVWLFLFLRCNSLVSYIVITLIGFLFFRLYNILFVALWGQTPGKMLARIHIVQTDGSLVGWWHAILRNSVETIIVSVMTFFEIYVVLHMPHEDFARTMMAQREELMQKMMPAFTHYLGFTMMVYAYSEYVVMWFNKRKRAIHDFIGGTIIIHDPREDMLPWRRFKVMRDIEDKIEEISFEDFLDKHEHNKISDPAEPRVKNL